MDEIRQYWFPAKKYGWGWGLPSTWQGWVAVLLWLVAVGAVCRFMPDRASPLVIFAGIVVVTVPLAIVLWTKGEPTKWRWGEDSTPPRA
jgi:hypothetical protein